VHYFSAINISQVSVVTLFRYSRIFGSHFTGECAIERVWDVDKSINDIFL